MTSYKFNLVTVCRALGAFAAVAGAYALLGSLLPQPDAVRALVATISPAVALGLLLNGLALVVGETARIGLRRVRTLLFVASVLAMLLILMRYRGMAVPDLINGVVGPWHPAYGKVAIRPGSALGTLVASMVGVLIMLRPRRWRDALIHALLLGLIYFTLLGMLSFFLPRSAIQAHARYFVVGGYTGIFLFQVVLVGLWCLWLERRQHIAATVHFDLSRRRFWVITWTQCTIMVAGQISYIAVMAQIDAIHRDYLEAGLRLQTRNVGQALQNAGDLSEGLADRPLLIDMLRQANRARSAELDQTALRIAASMIRNDVIGVSLRDMRGALLATAGEPVRTSEFNYRLDPTRTLFWRDGVILRSSIALRQEQGIYGYFDIDARVGEIDQMLRSADAYGLFEQVYVCVPLDGRLIDCLSGAAQGRPFRTERASMGARGSAVTRAIDGQSGSIFGRDFDDTPVVVAYGNVAPYAVAVLGQIPEESIARRNGLVFAPVVLIVLALCWMMGISLRRPRSALPK